MHNATVIVQVFKTPRPISKQIHLSPSTNGVFGKGSREGSAEKRSEHKDKFRMSDIDLGKKVDQAQDIGLQGC